MKDSAPLVSVLTPSFEQGRYLRDTIESVLAQDYPAVELVVVDGGSTDETLALLAEYRGRVRFLSEPDNGQADALNKAFRIAGGEIIGWLNSDDFFIRKDAVSLAVAGLSAGNDVVYGHALYVGERNRVLKVSLRPRFSSSRLRRFDFLPQPATFLRRVAAPDPLVDPSLHYALDYALWLELDRRGARFERINAVLAAMRQHPDAKSTRDRPTLWRESFGLRGVRRGSLRESVGDITLLAGLKVAGLGRFGARALSVGPWPVELTLPPPVLRPLYQAGVLGSNGTTWLFPRALLSHRRWGTPGRPRG